MTDTTDIYKNHANHYDQLVTAEDHKGHLKKLLMESIDWKDKLIYEAGIGTGRVTKLYIDQVRYTYGFDRESHMLEQCQNNLINYKDKLSLKQGDNLNLKKTDEPADIFIEGWSFGHPIMENPDRLKEVFQSIYLSLKQIIKPDGTLVLIETYGTHVNQPSIPYPILASFYKLLEEEYGFQRHIISTDYQFDSVEEAARITGFFFGQGMADDILARQQTQVKEFTGVWIK